VRRGTEATDENYQLAHLTAAGLVVTFEPYQVAPYAAGPKEVTIPLHQIEPLLKERYRSGARR
jgi:hypothetical protein